MNTKNVLITIIAIAVIAAVGGFFLMPSDDIERITLSNYEAGPESIKLVRAELEQATWEERASGCLETDDRGQEVFCGASKERIDRLHAQLQMLIRESERPDETTQQEDIAGIRAFMGDSELALTYVRSGSPSNFNVARFEPFPEGGGGRSERAEGWERTVNVYQSAEEIEGTCSVYEFEVYPKTHDVVQVHTVYPDNYDGQCDQQGGLFAPRVSDDQIFSTGWAYLERALDNFAEVKDAIDPEAMTKDPTRSATDRYRWFWEDTDYQLPEGLSGDSAVDSRPTVRLFITSAGKLVQYHNTIPLFD